MLHLPRLTCALVVTFFVASCGGGAGESDATPAAQEISGIYNISVQVFGSSKLFSPLKSHKFYASAAAHDVIEIDSVRVAESLINMSLDYVSAGTNRTCQLDDMAMIEMTGGRFSIQLQPAYFRETLKVRCTDETDSSIQAIQVIATDPELSAYVDFFIERYIPTANDRQPNDPYSGYRQSSYYHTIYTFLAAAEIYLSPEIYGLDKSEDRYRKIELFLINSAESYFEPCVDYDVFSSFPSRQCRSVERVGEFYVWRSAQDSINVRTNHSKTEWRGSGGIAQAIKAILLRNPGDLGETCPVSDEPSVIRDSSLYCRAINVRRLIYEEVWKKHRIGIQNSAVPHYIAWTELMVDLFKSTREIAPDLNCVNCAADDGMDQVTSNIDGLLEFFDTDEDGFAGMTCHTPDAPRKCIWTIYDFTGTGSVEIGHQDITIHLLSKDNLDEVCAGESGTCVDVNALVRTFSEKTWVDFENIGNASGFPKFDMFLSGYCSENYLDASSSLQDFCWKFWYSETGTWPAYRKLFGWVNLGRYDRDLMIKLRRAADENHDDLLNTNDLYLRTFAVFLLRAESQAKNFLQ